MKTLQDYIDKLNSLNFKEMYNNDFFWTWDKTDEELEAQYFHEGIREWSGNLHFP